ncbi:hypothetical protein BGX28_000570 [Mortierella sp. GBA30]|nr:hypothetical protein BGX28_000570 [Mortierella sp. GBA30]
MQPVFANVRTNLSQLPRSISPHLASPSSPASASSSIRSISPVHSSAPQLRSRSSSPSPRRFASVLAYHPSPPLDSRSDQKKRVVSSENLGRLHGKDQEATGFKEYERNKESDSRDQSPSRIAVRNLEESWRRLELNESASPSPSSSPSPMSSHATFGSSSSSPLSKPPYRELVECTSFKETGKAERKQAEETKQEAVPATSIESDNDSLDPSSSVTASTAHNKNYRRNPSKTGDTDVVQPRTTGRSLERTPAALSKLPPSSSSSQPLLTTTTTAATATVYEHPQQVPHGQRTSFVTSSEARHILDLPSLLGKDPSMIPDVLAMPVPLQPSRPQPLSSSSSLLSKLDSKAESTAKALTKRYATKNLNMTEMEAHRMVQVMAAEIVALHEEREAMLQRMEQAKQDMLEAAKLLRIQADTAMNEQERNIETINASAGANEAEEMQDMSVSGDRGKDSQTRQSEVDEEEDQERDAAESPTWYTDAEKYWNSVPATINGMLGGLGQLARPDAVSSLRFLSEFVNPPSSSYASSILNPPSESTHGSVSTSAPAVTSTEISSTSTSNPAVTVRQKLPLPGSGPSHVLDCGAGIGRVTKQVLVKAFDHVDLVENCAAFVKQAKDEYLKSEIQAGIVGEVRCSGLQNVAFEGTSWEGRFDVIWCQWVLGHLTEEDLIAFFNRCKKGLKPGGLIFVKENNAKVGIVIDEEDSSMTRSDLVWKDMFHKAGLRLLREDVQRGFPSGLFAVKMYALEPMAS